MNLLDLYVKITADDQASGQMSQISTGMLAKAQLLADGIKGILSTIVSTAFNATKTIVGGSFDAYKEYEQLTGGVETLFQNASGTVIENAQNAFQTAGMSANQYMELVNTFANTLVNSVAKSHGAVQMTAEQIKSATNDIKRANQDAYTQEQRMMGDNLDAARESLQERYNARSEELANELKDMQKAQAEETEGFRKGVDEHVKLMQDEYDEKARVIDAELQLRLDAIDAELDALERQDDEQAEAEKKRERERKLASLQEAMDFAGSMDEKVAAEEEYNKYIEKIRSEDARESRQKRREELRNERKDAQDEASEKQSDLKSSYDEQIKLYQEQQAEVLKQMQEAQASQLEEARKHNQEELAELQKANSDQLKEMQRANEDALREYQRAQSDQEAVQVAALSQTDEYIEKTEADYEEAARLANVAVIDMSDNANKMGTSIDMLQNAYRGFSMGNFTMLDNLKLGFSGTKSEMERLLDTAEQIQASNGNMVSYSIDSFADMVDAIHTVQVEYETSGYKVDELEQKIREKSLTEEELTRVAQDWASSRKDSYDSEAEAYAAVVQAMQDGSLTAQDAIILTGTTSYEASQTIEGSMNAAAAAWENWLIALADPNVDIGEKTDQLVDTVITAAQNIIPRVGEILTTLFEVVQEHGPEIFEQLKTAIWNAIPDEWKPKVQEVIDTFKGFLEALKPVGDFLAENLPKAMDAASAGFKWLDENGESVKALFDAIGFIFKTVGDTFYKVGNNIGVVLADFVSGMEGTENVGGTVFYDIGEFVRNMGETFVSVKSTVEEVIGNILGFFDSLGNGIDTTIQNVIDWFTHLPQNILNALGDVGRLLWNAGESIIEGFWNGLKSMWDNVTGWVQGIGDWIADHKGPKQYDLNLLVPNGMWIMQGLEAGMRKAFPLIENAISDVSDMMSVDASMGLGMNGGAALPAIQGHRALPPVNVYLSYNAGEDATQLVGDMVGQLALYGYTFGERAYGWDYNNRVAGI